MLRRWACAAALLAATLGTGAPAGAQGTATAVPGAASAAPPIPFRKEATPGFDAERWGLGVGVALGACALALWWLRRRSGRLLPGALGQALGGSLRSRRIQVVESQRISAHASLMLLEIDGRPVLVGEHTGGLVMLELPDGLHEGSAGAGNTGWTDASARPPGSVVREASGA